MAKGARKYCLRKLESIRLHCEQDQDRLYELAEDLGERNTEKQNWALIMARMFEEMERAVELFAQGF